MDSGWRWYTYAHIICETTSRAEAEAKRLAEEEERRKREEEERKRREEEAERTRPWWARYDHLQAKLHRRVHALCCGQRARFHSDAHALFRRPVLPPQTLFMTLVCIMPGALFGAANKCDCEQLPDENDLLAS